MAEAFTPVRIGKMHFDESQGHRSQRIAQCNARMRKRAGVDDDELGAVGARDVDTVDQRTFVIGLEECELRAFFLRERSQLALNIRQRLAAINGRLARPEQIQIRAVQNQNAASDGGSRLI